MEPSKDSTPRKKTKGYGKRPLKQWVAIYVIIAVIVYGLIYLLFIHKGSGGGY
jgi:hypothetical protein